MKSLKGEQYEKKLAMLLAGVMLTGSLLTGCGGDSSSGDTTSDTKKEASNSDETGELEGDITFWHSFTQDRDLKPFKKQQINLWKKIRKLILK